MTAPEMCLALVKAAGKPAGSSPIEAERQAMLEQKQGKQPISKRISPACYHQPPHPVIHEGVARRGWET